MLLRTLIVLGLTAILRAQTEPPAAERPEYGGPSVLSRGMGASVLARQETVDLRPHIGVNGICDTGLTAFTVRLTENCRTDSMRRRSASRIGWLP